MFVILVLYSRIMQAAEKEGHCLAAVNARKLPEFNDSKMLYNIQLGGLSLLAC